MAETPEPPAIQIELIPVTPLEQNCSMIWNPVTKHAALVDPGGEADRLMAALAERGLTLTNIWLTHGHLDHAGAAQTLKERTGIPIEGPHREDKFLLDDIEAQGRRFGLTDGRNCTPDRWLDDGDTLMLDDVAFGVVHTPGHTPGHVVIFNSQANIAFVGDVLFAGSIGRTDFPRGDYDTLIASITGKLWPLGMQMRFVPGHGPMSTFGMERIMNPFVADRITGYAGSTVSEASKVEQKLAKRWQ
jgi:hydroxyacylglutathione hydrolase